MAVGLMNLLNLLILLVRDGDDNGDVLPRNCILLPLSQILHLKTTVLFSFPRKNVYSFYWRKTDHHRIHFNAHMATFQTAKPLGLTILKPFGWFGTIQKMNFDDSIVCCLRNNCME